MHQPTNSIQFQTALGAYAKSGRKKPETTIPENTYQYRRLIFNNILDIICNTFPISCQYIGHQKWFKIINSFFNSHRCQTPIFWQIPKEFLDFLKLENNPLIQDFHPALTNLMELEWIELEVFMMPNENIPPFIKTGNLDKDKLVLNPELKIIPLNYPVFKKQMNEITHADYGQYFVCIHRDLNNLQAYSNELGLIQVEILIFLSQQNNSLYLIYKYLESNPNYNQYSLNDLKNFIHFCIEKNIILGFEPPLT